MSTGHQKGGASQRFPLFLHLRRRGIFAIVAGIAVLTGLAPVVVDEVQKWRVDQQLDVQSDEMIAVMGLERVPDFHQRIDTVRTFLNDHSVHKIDETFWKNHGNMSAFGAGVIAHAKNPLGEPVHMECSTRSNLMARILSKFGYRTRIIAIFNTRPRARPTPGIYLDSHSFLEVMNPKTGRWESQDVDYDIYWRDKASGQRISIADSAEDLDKVEPCGRTICGWDTASREGIRAKRLKLYFDIIGITTERKLARYAFYTSRADLDTVYTKGNERGRFCEVEAKRCAQGFRDIRVFSTYGANLSR